MSAAAIIDDVNVSSVDTRITAGTKMVPGHLWAGIRGHVLAGIQTGDFLSAVFANDLLEAAVRADPISLVNLPGIMRFMQNYAPRACWGSRGLRDAWRRHGGVRGGAHNHAEVIAAMEARAAS